LDNLKKQKPFFFFFFTPERRKGSNLNISFHPLDKWGREKRLRQKKKQQLEREKGVFFFSLIHFSCDASLLGIYKKQTKEEEAGSSPEKTGLLIQKK
jgi:hypothetical protein